VIDQRGSQRFDEVTARYKPGIYLASFISHR